MVRSLVVAAFALIGLLTTAQAAHAAHAAQAIQAVRPAPHLETLSRFSADDERHVADRAEIAAIVTAEVPGEPIRINFITNEYQDRRLVRQSLCPVLIDAQHGVGDMLVSEGWIMKANSLFFIKERAS